MIVKCPLGGPRGLGPPSFINSFSYFIDWRFAWSLGGTLHSCGPGPELQGSARQAAEEGGSQALAARLTVCCRCCRRCTLSSQSFGLLIFMLETSLLYGYLLQLFFINIEKEKISKELCKWIEWSIKIAFSHSYVDRSTGPARGVSRMFCL
jgi:hypothetical protein